MMVATAVANGHTREELTRLAEEQAALRRVATHVAQGARPTDVFESVSTEAARLVPADAAALTRYETSARLPLSGAGPRAATTSTRETIRPAGDRVRADLRDRAARADRHPSPRATLPSSTSLPRVRSDGASCCSWRTLGRLGWGRQRPRGRTSSSMRFAQVRFLIADPFQK